MYRCPNCGGEMVFSPEKQKLVCQYCDSEFDADEFDGKKGVNANSHENTDNTNNDDEDRYYQATVFTCPQCGGELLSTSDTAATFCSFCGASVLLESRVSNELKPDYIIPFKKTKEECKANYKKMLSKALFVPKAMKEDAQIDKFRSIYMPYWIYSFDYDGAIVTEGKTSTRRGDYIYTRHYRLETEANLDYEGISFDASSSFADNLSESVSPFEMSEMMDFKAAYMTGHYADTRDVGQSVYEDSAADVVKKHAAGELYEDAAYKAHGVDTSNIEESITPVLKDVKMGFFPVWFLSNRSKSGDRVSYAVMNGQTGKIAADLPIGFPKYMIASFIVAIPIFLLLSFVLNITLTPRMMHIAALILSLFAVFISNNQLNMVYTRDHSFDDKGYMAKRGQNTNNVKTPGKSPVSDALDDAKKIGAGMIWGIALAAAFICAYFTENIIVVAIVFVAIFAGLSIIKAAARRLNTEVYTAPFGEKIKILWKPFLGLALSIVMIIINPYEDMIQYAAAIISMALIGWSFKDIVGNYNHLTMRKLPQLGARGGDENA